MLLTYINNILEGAMHIMLLTQKQAALHLPRTLLKQGCCEMYSNACEDCHGQCTLNYSELYCI